MVHFALAAVPGIMKIVMGIWVFAALILIFIVLIQKDKGGGLGAAFGGVGNSLLGTKTGDVLTWITICFVAAWLLLSVAAAKWFKPSASGYLQTQQAQPVRQMPASRPAQQPQIPDEATQLPQTPQQPQMPEAEVPAEPITE
ncbi:MAG: preprotein translocase subunit SecG [Sedimentisphaerales bacterium]|nr:preprotein translocase subunit SecG [Sedimentisphaerales bacterium]